MTRAAAAALAATALTLAGCGGGAPAAPVASDRIEMAKSYRFAPESVRVAVGTTVAWHNADNFTHTVKVEDGETEKVAPGDTYTRRFARAGTFAFVCTLHPGMSGEVLVG
jgi:plastocyanin